MFSERACEFLPVTVLRGWDPVLKGFLYSFWQECRYFTETLVHTHIPDPLSIRLLKQWMSRNWNYPKNQMLSRRKN